MISIFFSFFALCIFLNAQQPRQPQGPEERLQGNQICDRFGNCRPRDFRVGSPVFLQCECTEPVGVGSCRTWRCLDLDVDRRR